MPGEGRTEVICHASLRCSKQSVNYVNFI